LAGNAILRAHREKPALAQMDGVPVLSLAHTTALPLAMAVLLFVVSATPAWRIASARPALITAVVAALQIPWVIDRMRSGGVSADTAIRQSVLAAIADPLARLRPAESCVALLRALVATPVYRFRSPRRVQCSSRVPPRSS
jgi:hypothetical protein